ncbi:HAD-IIIC family phosphatase [Polynucleobacter paneuropaeus]|nr:HAD-IIIC family phosphatase [Polynucleobacter paneuropaeus]
MKKIVIDLDDTISKTIDSDYKNSQPIVEIIELLQEYRKKGFEIVISTSRNMRTFNANVGKINAVTLPIIVEWLQHHRVPFDEIHIGKPWCGTDGFYVDDKAIRPSEFLANSYEEIIGILNQKK